MLRANRLGKRCEEQKMSMPVTHNLTNYKNHISEIEL